MTEIERIMHEEAIRVRDALDVTLPLVAGTPEAAAFVNAVKIAVFDRLIARWEGDAGAIVEDLVEDLAASGTESPGDAIATLLHGPRES